MAISGFLGFSFFLVANFSNLFLGLNLVSGIMQIILNTFVFTTWLKGFRESIGFRKFIAFWGVVIPFFMAGITLVRVILPAIT